MRGDFMSQLPVEYRAGGIACRKVDDRLEFLMVTSNSNKERWILPAGHIEPGENPEEAAVREVREEAGISCEIIADLGNIQYTWFRNNQKTAIDTRFFLMRYLETLEINPEGRQVKFFRFDQLDELNLWDETRNFLKKAQEFKALFLQN